MVSEDAGVCIGDANRNPYGEAALELYHRGLFPIPCGGDDGKRPTGIKGWQRMKRPPRTMIEGLALKPKLAFGPVRLAVTGRRISPPLFESLELLGRESSLARIDACARG